MKSKLFAALLACVAAFGHAEATPFVNLTPKAKEMTVSTGELTLPQSFAIGHTALPEEMQAEIAKFAATFSRATGITLTEGSTGLMTITVNPALHAEGYKLDVTADGVSIEASAPAGLYYAFQSVMKIMPANVILGKFVGQAYSLPLVSINDEPRYPWRGMEIDVARHFFDVDQMKKMIDIMAVYKMNRLHWHLTDDQGWRFEMPKYPKLTTEAGAPLNCYWWDFDNHKSYLTNEMYGPYFYTVEEMKEVVAYAKERHIEVCPEVDMPGHMQCAIAAYPEFSTTPDGDHPVRFWPGVSTDVLDLSNPAVMQFLKDIIDQLAEIFPYEYIHIGGDECPTSAWANSASCQAFKKEYGLQSDRAIQNWMVKELAEYARKDNRKLICWNEVITTSGADHKLAQDADILIYSWLGAGTENNPSKLAASLGLRSVWCSTSHYYIDYPQWNGPDEPKSMGYALTLEHVYNARPDYEEAKKELYYGVNCNLWTEFVCENKHLEYNALPRMIAVAEAGWTPQALKNFDDFRQRFNADTKLLDLGNYTYGRHYVDDSSAKQMPEAGKYYRLITQASHDPQRKDRCIELVHDGCQLIASKGAAAGKLWTNVQAEKGSADYDWQYWTFEPDPAGSGKYAMVNRQAPEGSVSPDMTGSSVAARWVYDNNAKHYNFLVGENYSTADLGPIHSIRSDKGATWYLNCAQNAQSLSVNNWNNPLDGNGGMWLFHLEDYVPSAVVEGHPFTPLTSGNYAFVNSLGRGPLSITANRLTTEPDPAFGPIGWAVTAGAYDEATNTQTLTLKNMATNLYIAGVSDEPLTNIPFTDSWNVFGGNGGYDITFTDKAEEAAAVTLNRVSADSDTYFLSVGGKRLFAFGADSSFEPYGVNANAGSPEAQGSAWLIKKVVNAVNATAVENRNAVGNFTHYDLEGETPASDPIAIPYALYEYVSQTTVGENPDGALNVTVNVRKIKRTVTYVLTDTKGLQWETVTDTIGVDDVFTPQAPVRPYLTFERMGEIDGDVATVIYTTEAIPGIRKLGEPVSSVSAGGTYAIEDTHSERHAFRGAQGNIVGGSRSAEGCSPAFLWTLEANGANFNVRNAANGKYIQAVTRGTTATLADNPYAFAFTYNSGHWTIKNSGNALCWDGNADLTLVGWDSPGHAIRIYPLAEAEPYFTLTVSEQLDGVEFESRTVLVKAGSGYMFAANSRPGKVLVGIEGNEGLDEIYANKRIVVKYKSDENAINEIAADQTPGIKGIYDLSGRRLSKVGRHGVYIVNGVKTLVK